MKILEPWGLILILVIVIILFGPRRLPDLGKALRKRMTVFRDEADPDVAKDDSEKPHGGGNSV